MVRRLAVDNVEDEVHPDGEERNRINGLPMIPIGFGILG
jgi:hypothetical protein